MRQVWRLQYLSWGGGAKWRDGWSGDGGGQQDGMMEGGAEWEVDTFWPLTIDHFVTF